jgi:hypothetical protein
MASQSWDGAGYGLQKRVLLVPAAGGDVARWCPRDDALCCVSLLGVFTERFCCGEGAVAFNLKVERVAEQGHEF